MKEGEETQIDLAARAIEAALNNGGYLKWQTSTAWFRLGAVGVQLIPCTAAPDP